MDFNCKIYNKKNKTNIIRCLASQYLYITLVSRQYILNIKAICLMKQEKFKAIFFQLQTNEIYTYIYVHVCVFIFLLRII